MNFDQAFKTRGIDEKKALRNLRAMLSRRTNHRGPRRIIPGVADHNAYTGIHASYGNDAYYIEKHAKKDRDLSPRDYIRRFEELNHLKPIV